MWWSYSLYTAGTVLLIPAVLALATCIGTVRPLWGMWGATFTLLGLCARTFHAGVDHMAFQLVDVQDRASAHQAVADSYPASYVLQVANPLALIGWLVLVVVGLCVAMVPFGFHLLRTGSQPALLTVLRCGGIVAVGAGVVIFLGQAG